MYPCIRAIFAIKQAILAQTTNKCNISFHVMICIMCVIHREDRSLLVLNTRYFYKRATHPCGIHGKNLCPKIKESPGVAAPSLSCLASMSTLEYMSRVSRGRFQTGGNGVVGRLLHCYRHRTTGGGVSRCPRSEKFTPRSLSWPHPTRESIGCAIMSLSTNTLLLRQIL